MMSGLAGEQKEGWWWDADELSVILNCK